MTKYWQVFKTSWANGFVYRLNFVMWRVRSLIHLITLYFLWLAIFTSKNEMFGYDRSIMLTYILVGSVVWAFLGSRSQEIGVEISQGNLNNYLIKPLNYFSYWFTRDLSDKLLNFIFVIFELALFFIIFKPPLVLPQNLLSLALSLLAVFLGMLIYFFLSFIISSFTFWYPEQDGWPLRFITFVLIDFTAGGLFPLDILPPLIFKITRFLPPAYLLFYPLQIYLNRLSFSAACQVILISCAWLFILYLLSRLIWRQGLKIYGAYGR